jgi:hypothetical protein
MSSEPLNAKSSQGSEENSASVRATLLAYIWGGDRPLFIMPVCPCHEKFVAQVNALRVSWMRCGRERAGRFKQPELEH